MGKAPCACTTYSRVYFSRDLFSLFILPVCTCSIHRSPASIFLRGLILYFHDYDAFFWCTCWFFSTHTLFSHPPSMHACARMKHLPWRHCSTLSRRHLCSTFCLSSSFLHGL